MTLFTHPLILQAVTPYTLTIFHHHLPLIRKPASGARALGWTSPPRHWCRGRLSQARQLANAFLAIVPDRLHGVDPWWELSCVNPKALLLNQGKAAVRLALAPDLPEFR
jgi:hypothetical protein